MFLIAHVDYVRSVRVLPRGPEATELVVEWLFPPGVLERPDFDLEHAVALGRLVVEQDGRICELNQKGLHCMRHDSGVLVPQEYGVRELQDWVRRALGTAA
jgi:Rieske 2Fe-2S family protein